MVYTAKVRNAYQKTEAQAQVHPVKLIHLLYERVLVHLEMAEQGMAANDIKARGENLSKAIAIIAELNASIKDGDDSEVAGFLRGLYSAILMELPKVSVANDVAILRQSRRYLKKLLEIWETTAMVEAGLAGGSDDERHNKDIQSVARAASGSPPVCAEYDATATPKKFKTRDTAAGNLHGVSVSI